MSHQVTSYNPRSRIFFGYMGGLILGIILLLSAFPAQAAEQGSCTCKVRVVGQAKNGDACGIPRPGSAQTPPEISVTLGQQFKIRDFFNSSIEGALTRSQRAIANPNYCPPIKKNAPGVNRLELERALASPKSYTINTSEECDKFEGNDTVPYQWDAEVSPGVHEGFTGFYAIAVASCKATYSEKETPVLSNKPDGYAGPLPDCAFYNIGCRNTNELLQLLVNIGHAVFGVMGMWALIFFIYGGVRMIVSMGNAEQFKKGRDALVASIVGLIISFSAYLIVEFILDALQVSPEFRPPVAATAPAASGETPNQNP